MVSETPGLLQATTRRVLKVLSFVGIFKGPTMVLYTDTDAELCKIH